MVNPYLPDFSGRYNGGWWGGGYVHLQCARINGAGMMSERHFDGYERLDAKGKSRIHTLINRHNEKNGHTVKKADDAADAKDGASSSSSSSDAATAVGADADGDSSMKDAAAAAPSADGKDSKQAEAESDSGAKKKTRGTKRGRDKDEEQPEEDKPAAKRSKRGAASAKGKSKSKGKGNEEKEESSSEDSDEEMEDEKVTVKAKPKAKAPPKKKDIKQLFPKSMTVAQLKKACKEHKVNTTGLSLKADLVKALEAFLEQEHNNERARLQADYDNNNTPPASPRFGAVSVGAGGVDTRPGFLRIPAGCVTQLSQYLRFAELAQLAPACSALNSLCSLRMKGEPSAAMRRRQVLDVSPPEWMQLPAITAWMQRMPQLRVVKFRHSRKAFKSVIDALLNTSGPSLRVLRIQGGGYDSWDADQVERMFAKCPNLEELRLMYNGRPTKLAPLPNLRKVQAYDLTPEMLDAMPNLTELSSNSANVRKLLIERKRTIDVLNSSSDWYGHSVTLKELAALQVRELVGTIASERNGDGLVEAPKLKKLTGNLPAASVAPHLTGLRELTLQGVPYNRYNWFNEPAESPESRIHQFFTAMNAAWLDTLSLTSSIEPQSAVVRVLALEANAHLLPNLKTLNLAVDSSQFVPQRVWQNDREERWMRKKALEVALTQLAKTRPGVRVVFGRDEYKWTHDNDKPVDDLNIPIDLSKLPAVPGEKVGALQAIGGLLSRALSFGRA